MGSTQPGPYFDLRRVNLTQPDKGIVVMPFDDCKPTRPVPIHHFHGDLDLTIGLRGVMTGTGPESTSYPANGGTWSDPGYGSLPAGRHVIGRLNTTAEIMEWWRRKNGCDEDFQVVDVGDSGVAVTRACATDPRKAVGLMVFKGEGHTWPGNGADIAQLQLSRKGRTTNYTTNTTAVVWDWLKRFNLPGPEEEVNGGHLFLGVSFSFFGNLGIAASMCVQKRAHNMIVDDGDKIKFYQSPMWWFGMIMNIIGEVGNLLAYGFAPASVVAPVGAVGVVGNCIFAWYFLKEHLGVRDFIGTGVVMIGVILVVVGAPETSHHSSMDAWEFYYFVAKPVRPPPPTCTRAHTHDSTSPPAPVNVSGSIRYRSSTASFRVYLALCFSFFRGRAARSYAYDPLQPRSDLIPSKPSTLAPDSRSCQPAQIKSCSLRCVQVRQKIGALLHIACC
jgi:hypothetical protein